MTASLPTCPDLDAYLDGDLDDHERAAVDVHLAGCPACTEEVALMVHVGTALRSLSDVACPPGVVEAALAQARRTAPDRQPARSARPARWRVPAFAGVALAALAVLALTLRPDTARVTPAGPTVAQATPPTPDPGAEALEPASTDGGEASALDPTASVDEPVPARPAPQSTAPSAESRPAPPASRSASTAPEPTAPEPTVDAAPADPLLATGPTAPADSAAIARDQIYLALALVAEAQEQVAHSIGQEADRLSGTLRSATPF